MQNLNLFSLFTDILQDNSIDYFITGSIASIVYGEPRLTHDIDLIVSLGGIQVEKYTKVFNLKNFYCPPVEVINTRPLNYCKAVTLTLSSPKWKSLFMN